MVTMSAEYLRTMDRCISIQKVLGSLKEKNSPQYFTHAKNQALCLKNLLKDVSLKDDEEMAACAGRITAIGFPRDIECELIESLTVREGIESPSPTHSRKLQNYEAFIYYLLECMWEAMRQADEHGAVEVLVGVLLSLGLRHPSCATFGMMATVWCILKEGETATLDKSKVEKWKKLEYVKDVFRRSEKLDHVDAPARLPTDVSG